MAGQFQRMNADYSVQIGLTVQSLSTTRRRIGQLNGNALTACMNGDREMNPKIQVLTETTPTLLGTRPPWPVLVCREGKVVGKTLTGIETI